MWLLKTWYLKHLYFIISFFLLSILAVPFFEIKLLVVLGCCLIFLTSKHTISRNFSFWFLFLIYSFAFILSPYWQVFFTHASLKYITLLLLVMCGVIWAWATSSSIRLPRIKNITPYVILSLFLYFILSGVLGNDIPWRGDEDFHIQRISHLVSYLRLLSNWIPAHLGFVEVSIVGIVSGIYLIVQKLIPKQHRLIGLGALFIFATAVYLYPTYVFKNPDNPLFLSEILRYPLFQTWLHIPFIYLTPFQDIRLYRIVPFISVFGVGYFLLFILTQKLKSIWLALLLAVGMTTIPLVLFYGTLLYLELPLVLALLIIIFWAKGVVIWNIATIRTHPVWLTLSTAGFLKETGFVIVFTLLLMRLIFQSNIHTQKHRIKFFLSELKLWLQVLWPSIVYLIFRNIFSSHHPYEFRLSNIVVFSHYVLASRALLTQIGLLTLVGIGGLIQMFRKDRLHFVILMGIFLITFWFFLCYVYLDFSSSPEGVVYVGYSRWNLYLLPIIYTGALMFYVSFNKKISLCLGILIIIFNVYLFPFNKSIQFPNWGSPSADAGEYIYPYNQAIREVILTHPKKIALVGAYSPYGSFEFYFNAYQFHPNLVEYSFGVVRFNKDEEIKKLREFDELLIKNELKNFKDVEMIIYHSVNNIEIFPKLGDFLLYKVVQNTFHGLYLFRKSVYVTT